MVIRCPADLRGHKGRRRAIEFGEHVAPIRVFSVKLCVHSAELCVRLLASLGIASHRNRRGGPRPPGIASTSNPVVFFVSLHHKDIAPCPLAFCSGLTRRLPISMRLLRLI